MRELRYPGRTLLSRWIDDLAPGIRKADKPHKRSTDEERIETLLESAVAPTAKQVVEARGIDKATFHNWIASRMLA